MIRRLILLALTAFALTVHGETMKPTDGLVYFGTYTGAKSKGIYVARLDKTSGALTAPELVAETPSPSFLTLSPNRHFLYAANEAGPSGTTVSAFAVDAATGKLTALNEQPCAGGPCHLVVDKTGKMLIVANYGNGSVVAYPLGSDGRLGAQSAMIQHRGTGGNPQRQEGPHAHCVAIDAANHFVFCADLGLDKVLSYRLDPAHATLIANDPAFAATKPGSGPRHLAFHPSGRFVFVINELDSTLSAWTYDAKRGALSEIQSLPTLPADFKGNNSTAEIAVHPNGKFVYGSNRGHDSIVIYAYDEKTGKLTLVGHQSTGGKTPRNFAIDPSGNFLLAANQNSDTVVVFRLDPKTGQLAATGQSIEVGAPVCVTFMP